RKLGPLSADRPAREGPDASFPGSAWERTVPEAPPREAEPRSQRGFPGSTREPAFARTGMQRAGLQAALIRACFATWQGLAASFGTPPQSPSGFPRQTFLD